MFLRISALSATLLALGLCAEMPKAQTGFSAILAAPTGDFSDDANASVGFGAMLEHNSPFISGPLGWVTSFGFTFNPSDKDGLEEGLEAEGGNYLDIPVLTGLRLTSTADGPIRFYFQGQLGLQLFYVTDLTMTDGFNKATVTSDINIHLGFGGGVGMLFNDKVHAGLRFFSTPEMEMTGTLSEGSDSIDLTGEVTVSMIQVHLGLLF
jgi:hypothetical protein